MELVMKKSELFKRIEDAIYRETVLITSSKSEIAVRATEAAMMVIDEAGMLPPSSGRLTTNYTDMGVMPDHSWEPEDENA
jgi:hypothetical protein